MYCVLAAAAALALLVGARRVYLGVRYPTDVAAGWAVGLAWALACAAAAARGPSGRRADRGTEPEAR